jgi:hypothetical protein
MTVELAVSTDAWDAAVRRATAVVDRDRPGGMDEDNWDTVAMRDIIAVILYALHTRSKTAVEAVPWSQVLWWLWDDENVIALVEDTIPGTAEALTEPGGELDNPVLARWRWLNRTWDPDAPIRRRNLPATSWEFHRQQRQHESGTPLPEPRWEGMSRGIGDGLPDPAIEICTHWAAGVVATVFSAEQGGYATHQRVRVVSGEFAGQGGYVQDIGWVFHDEAQQVTGPTGYVVDLDDTKGTEDIDAEHLEPASDYRWARRPEGTLKDGPPPGLHDPLPPTPSCAEDLESLLADASNPEAVPEELRQRIRDGYRHHHRDMRRRAAPRPHRTTAQLLLHWYELTEPYVDDPSARAEIWELVVTEHLRDDAPLRLLATSEEEAKALAAQHTGLTL